MEDSRNVKSRKFEWIVDSRIPQPTNEWDVEVAGNCHFSVVPSLGSLLPGWVLVVPRRRLINLHMLTPEERLSLDRLCSEVHRPLSIFRGSIFEFEHGSTFEGSVMGCGVDQAHLHIVPLPFDLIQAAKKISKGEITWLEVDRVSDLWSCVPDSQEYVMIREPGGRSAIGLMTHPESQWLRKVISANLPQPVDWDYRRGSGLYNIRATIRAFVTDADPLRI